MALCYSRSTLFSIFSSINKPQRLRLDVWQNLVRLGITRRKPTRRGCRAGCLKMRPIPTVELTSRQNQGYQLLWQITPLDSSSSSGNLVSHLHTDSVDLLNIQNDTFRPSSSIVIQCTPMAPAAQKHHPALLRFCCANVRAVKSKTADIREYIFSADMDIFAITKTWLQDRDTAAKQEFYSSNTHTFMQQNRRDRCGGGTGLLFKNSIVVNKLDGGEKRSFEFSEWRVASGPLRVKLVIFYRPPYSTSHPINPSVFFQEFSSYLESIILSPESLILVGDFNFHVDVPTDPDA